VVVVGISKRDCFRDGVHVSGLADRGFLLVISERTADRSRYLNRCPRLRSIVNTARDCRIRVDYGKLAVISRRG